MAGVRLENVSKAYGRHTVIRDLSFTIHDGECFTFLGPSGCGKTVVLRMIAGFEQPDSGEIRIGEQLVSCPAKKIFLPPEKRRIGVVFQDYAVWPHKTVYENVIYPLAIQKVPKEEAAARALKTVGMVNLGGLERRLPFQLSGGQQQRVALARALVSRPDIMLLDEPLSNLDANLREEMRFEIKDLQKTTGVTILYVTHDQEVALAISDRVAIMDQTGAIRQIGPPDDIYEKPADSFVFKFMGVSNFIPLECRNGMACVQGSDAVVDYPVPEAHAETLRTKGVMAACRPFDIRIVPDEAKCRGLLKRAVYLGSVMDYRIQVGATEIRVQQDIQEALAQERMFREGDVVGLQFLDLKWFPCERDPRRRRGGIMLKRYLQSLGIAEILLMLSVLVLVVVVAIPVLLIFWTALFVDGQFNLKDIVKVLSEPDTYEALKNSIVIAVGVTFFSTIIGVFFAWLVSRTDLPFKNTMKLLFLVPFMLPSFIGALAWKMLLSPRSGYVNKFIMNAFGFEGSLFDIYSLAGIIAVETMYLFPFVFIQVSGALERMDPTLEESARISGAGLVTITRKITLPLMLPSIAAGALLVALYSLSHFGVPAILGTEAGIYNIPTKIYERIYQSAGSFAAIRTGTILSAILVISAGLILYAQSFILKAGHFQVIAGKSMRPVLLKLRGLKVPLLIFSILYILITVILPTVTIFMVGTLKTYGLEFTLENMTLGKPQVYPLRLEADQGCDLEQFLPVFGRCLRDHAGGHVYLVCHCEDEGAGQVYPGVSRGPAFLRAGDRHRLRRHSPVEREIRRQSVQYGLDHPGRLHCPVHGLFPEIEFGGPGAGP